MDWGKLLDLAGKLGDADLLIRGAQLAAATAEYVTGVKAAADRAAHVLQAGDRAELDAIHAEALLAADQLDAKLAVAERRG